MTNEEILKKHIPQHQIWGNGITGKPFLQNALLETVLSALEEAREDERNQGRGEGPVWVKAQDELPTKSGHYFVKGIWNEAKTVHDSHGVGIFEPVFNNKWFSYRKTEEIFPTEWLKEPDNN